MYIKHLWILFFIFNASVKLFLVITHAQSCSNTRYFSHAGGLLFESQLRQTKVVKIGSDSSTAKRSTLGVSRVLGDDHYKQMPRVTVDVGR